jgi:hypothetical protein
VFLREQIVYHLFIMNPLPRNPIPYDQPASYQIKIQGRIDPSMSDLLEGLTISIVNQEGIPPVTILEGELRDQAALAGVLNSLYEMHLLVLSVQCMSI